MANQYYFSSQWEASNYRYSRAITPAPNLPVLLVDDHALVSVVTSCCTSAWLSSTVVISRERICADIYIRITRRLLLLVIDILPKHCRTMRSRVQTM